MGEDDIATEYPEHLNPFKEPKKRSAIGNSFRNLKRTLRQSFRLKNRDDKKVEVRRTDQSAGAAHLNHRGTETVALRKPNTVQRSNTLVLPRSRFNERVNHAKTLCPSATDQLNSSNPFEEDADEKPDETDKSPLNPFAEEEIPATDTLRKRHRRKKRAPLPPQLNRSEGNLLSVPDHHNSKWSLNSYDTDISNYASETETEFNDDHEPSKEDVSTDHLKDIQEMTAEIQKLCTNDIKEEVEEEEGEDTNRNVAMNDNAHSDSINNTDQNVILGDNADKDNEKPTDNESSEKVKIVCEEKIANDNNLNVAENHSNDDPEIPTVNYEKQINEVVESTNVAQSDLETINKTELADVKIEAEIIISIIENIDDVAVQHKDIKAEVVEGDENVVSEDASVLVDDDHERKEETVLLDDHNNNTDELSGVTDVHFYESKSMYIAGSNDNLLEFNQRKSIYVSGSRDELNNNLEMIDEDQQPIPKIRKHKLTRGSLLGRQDNA
ncbi:PREDICTED: myb-like protein X [Nicrophorus vespilloides]|uniref:Myb-like protein X n=1 Tax=Nicrophorus vespilloides TaxID=110193 RepID=A0ABM1MHI7_NICVS|nr:PREDICTED: myb-like protein X [Nicrophorus vespilloides]